MIKGKSNNAKYYFNFNSFNNLVRQLQEPAFTLIDKSGNIEIREYSENIIAKTSILNEDGQMDNSMFRTLAGYIFGGNDRQQSIPMTTPVITSKKENSYSMIFFMLDVKDKKDLPSPNSSNVKIETINLGKFMMFSENLKIKLISMVKMQFPFPVMII